MKETTIESSSSKSEIQLATMTRNTGHFLFTFSRERLIDVFKIMRIKIIQFKERTLKSSSNNLNLFDRFLKEGNNIAPDDNSLMEKYPYVY